MKPEQCFKEFLHVDLAKKNAKEYRLYAIKKAEPLSFDNQLFISGTLESASYGSKLLMFKIQAYTNYKCC